jgi:SAM-dependent methyltransferase
VISHGAESDNGGYPAANGDRSLRISLFPPQAEEYYDRLLELIGSPGSALVLGAATGIVPRELKRRGCRVVVAGCDLKDQRELRTYCERLIPGDLESLDLEQAVGRATIDAVVAPDALACVRNPERVLATAKDLLTPGGALTAAVPNVAHGSVRLALLEGRFPSGADGLIDRSHLRFFTRDSLFTLFSGAGLAITHFEARDLAFTDGDAPDDAYRLPKDALTRLARDPDARAHRFLVVARPLPTPELDWIQPLLRAAHDRNEGATREVASLKQAMRVMSSQLRALSDRVAKLTRQEQETRAQLLRAHDHLASQDEQFRRTARDLIAAREAVEAHLGRALREVTAERNAFEGRLIQIGRSIPGRAYRLARSVFTRGKH